MRFVTFLCQNQRPVSPYWRHKIQLPVAHFKSKNTQIPFKVLKSAVLLLYPKLMLRQSRLCNCTFSRAHLFVDGQALEQEVGHVESTTDDSNTSCKLDNNVSEIVADLSLLVKAVFKNINTIQQH